MALQLKQILASAFVTLGLQFCSSPGSAADSPQLGSLLTQVPIAIPLQHNRTPEARPAQPSAGAVVARPRVITPTTGLVTIESDLQQADNTTGIVTATGNVRIVYPDQRVVATARQAQYFSREGRVVLSGDVDVVQQDGSLLRAEQVTYLVGLERITARPAANQQVFSRLRLTPTPKPGTPAVAP